MDESVGQAKRVGARELLSSRETLAGAAWRRSTAALLDVARRRGAQIHEGCADAPTFVELGEVDAPRLRLLVVGLRGQHGVAGALMARHLLERAPDHDADLRTVVLHGADPWACARASSTTREGVDLDRNFVDFDGELPANLAYARVHAPLVYTRLDGAIRREADQALHDIQASLPLTVADIVDRGQYDFADGLAYGGAAPTRARREIEALIPDMIAGARHVEVITLESGGDGWGQVEIEEGAARGSFAAALDGWLDERTTTSARTLRAGTHGRATSLDLLRDAALVRLGADRQVGAMTRVRDAQLAHHAPADLAWAQRLALSLDLL